VAQQNIGWKMFTKDVFRLLLWRICW